VTGVTLAAPHVQRFLAAKEVVVLATLQRDGAPLAMPMWFLPDADGLTMISVADTQKVRNLRRDPRVSVVAESVSADGAICGVTVQGRAEFLEDGAARRALAERLLARYHPRLERLWRGRQMPPDRVMFRVVVAHVKTWGLA
jgi:PPOX class probable F420-dependent enzyme